MAISLVKSAKKGKRHPEESIEKQSAAKKLKREVEEAVEKQRSGKKSKASFKVAPKKKPETSSSEDVSSSKSEKEVCSIEADCVFLYANIDVPCLGAF
ncbi:nucleolin 1-like [Magnolia sinica]|uniref:nucleolin 1-like n=1 Tax=Magnolia sinica TaxID=86752 RepID=UPI0026598AA4|nr:nucleolin 1-like [Magnolia sinica]